VYAEADLFVAPSIVDATGDRDGLPNVVLEAMASGRPVVGGDVGALASGVIDGETGVLVPPGDPAAVADAVVDALGDERRRAAMGAAARELAVERYGWEHVAAELVQIYDAVAGREAVPT
jgi:glycosyltransferase involved in cell wall biosynthesis